MRLPTKLDLEIHRNNFTPVLRELELQFSRNPDIPEIRSCVDNMTRMSQMDSSLVDRVNESKSTITNFDDLPHTSQETINEGLDVVLTALSEIPLSPQEIGMSAVVRYTYIVESTAEANSKLNFSFAYFNSGKSLEDYFIFPEAIAKVSVYFTSKTDGLTALEYLVNSSLHFDMISALATQQHLMVILGPPIFLSLGAPLLLNGNLNKLFSAALAQCRRSSISTVTYSTPIYNGSSKFTSPPPLGLPSPVNGSHTQGQLLASGSNIFHNYRAGLFGVGFIALFGYFSQNMLGGFNQNLLYRGFWNMLLPTKPTSIAEKVGPGLNTIATGFFRGLFKKP
jgi:hypothetical protein